MTSTLLLIGGAVAVGYYLSKRETGQSPPLIGKTVTGALAREATPTTQVVVMTPDINDDYGPGWGWSAPVWGGRAWSAHGGGHHSHRGHGGHGRHGGHR